MPLSLGPQCCCGVLGITRTFASGWTELLLNPAYDFLESGQFRFVPCWATGNVLQPALGHTMGYHDRDDLAIINGSAGSGWGGEYPAQDCILALSVNDCEIDPVGAFPYTGGMVPHEILVTREDRETIENAAIPDGDWFYTYSYFGNATNSRLYGHTYCQGLTTHDDHKLVVWSTDYTGNDFTTHFTITDERLETPVVCNVQNMRENPDLIFSVGTNDDGDILIYQDDTISATIEGAGLINDLAGGVALVDGQFIYCPVSTPSSVNLKLYALTGTEAETDCRVELVVLDDTDFEVHFYPYSITWDSIARAAVVRWGPGEGGVGVFPSLATYITKPLVPGNIIGQEGVTVYGAYLVGYGPSSGGGSAYQPISWGTLIQGRAPVPLHFTGLHLDPPPPPPPPLPDCTDFDACATVDMPDLAVGIFGHENYDTAPAFEPNGVADHHLVENLNTTFTAPYYEIIPDGACAGTESTGGLRYFWKPHGTLGDYDDPGIKIFEREYIPGFDYHLERYVTDEVIGVRCTEGRAYIFGVLYSVQQFAGGTEYAEDWPPTAYNAAWCVQNFLDGEEGVILHAIARECRAGTMVSQFNYSVLSNENSSAGSQLFYAVASLGPTA